jgi:ParB-like chromosome segregation protein Spo0J
MSTDESFGLIPLDRIAPWKGNPRRHIDKVALDELAASIKA